MSPPAASNDGTYAGPVKRGVLAADKIKAVINSRDMIMAYAFICLIELYHGLANNSGGVYVPYATSAFGKHSMLATGRVLQRVLTTASFPVWSKLIDNVSRIGWYLYFVPVAFTIINLAMQAWPSNINVYVAGSVFGGLQSAAWNLLFAVHIAETTSITQRPLYNTAADSISTIVTMYSGTSLGGRILKDHGKQNGWRLGYWLWIPVEAVLCWPFILTLASWSWRSKRAIRQGRITFKAEVIKRPILSQIWFEYDILGVCLFGAGVALILVPLTLAKGLSDKWDGSNIAMIVVGFGLIIIFGLWEYLPARFRPSLLRAPDTPLIPFFMLRQRTILLLCILHMTDFMAYGIIESYFTTFAQVAVYMSPTKASQVDNTLRIVFAACALIVSIVVRFYSAPTLLSKYLPKSLNLNKKRSIPLYYIIVPGSTLMLIGVGIDLYFMRHPHAKHATSGLIGAKVAWGLGRACQQTLALVAVQMAASRMELSVGTAIFNISSALGGTIGSAVGSAIWINRYPKLLSSHLPAEAKPMANKIFGSIVVAMKYPKGSTTRDAIDESMAITMFDITITSFCLLFVGWVACFFIERDLTLEISPKTDQPGLTSQSELEKRERAAADVETGKGGNLSASGAPEDKTSPDNQSESEHDEKSFEGIMHLPNDAAGIAGTAAVETNRA